MQPSAIPSTRANVAVVAAPTTTIDTYMYNAPDHGFASATTKINEDVVTDGKPQRCRYSLKPPHPSPLMAITKFWAWYDQAD